MTVAKMVLDELLHRGHILVSVHQFPGAVFHALVTVAGDVGEARRQAEAEGATVAAAVCLAVAQLFVPRSG